MRAPSAIDLDSATAHPHGEADAAVEGHRDPDLFGPPVGCLCGGSVHLGQPPYDVTLVAA
jgi:hypothetical protein